MEIPPKITEFWTDILVILR